MADLKFSKTRTMIEPVIIFVSLSVDSNSHHDTLSLHLLFASVVSRFSFCISSVHSHDCLAHQPQFPASVNTWTVRAKLLLTSMYHSSMLLQWKGSHDSVDKRKNCSPVVPMLSILSPSEGKSFYSLLRCFSTIQPHRIKQDWKTTAFVSLFHSFRFTMEFCDVSWSPKT